MARRDRVSTERQTRLLHTTLIDGLKAAGIEPTPAGVLDALESIGENDLSLERSVARDLDGQVGTANRKDTRRRWELYEAVIRRKSPKHADLLGEQCRALRSGDLPSSVGPDIWFSVIPRQEGRPYASVDRVSIESSDGDVISGTVQRLSPTDQRGLHWNFHGTRYAEAIFVSFWPLELRNARSRGTIALTRPDYESARAQPDRYEGTYTRLLDASTGLLSRTYGWYKEVPASAFPRVALLDLDNTLVADWTIRPWLQALSRRPDWRKEATACAAEIEDFIVLFKQGSLDHDELVCSCEQSYIKLMTGRTLADADDAAAVFFDSRKNRKREHDFVRPLVDFLKDRGVAPVIVSGAPAELVSRYARSLGISEWYGLQLCVEANKYTGAVRYNPGTTAEKERIVAQTLREKREVVLALGDSESDVPLWDVAPNKVIVGDGYSLDEFNSDEVFRIDPTTTTWVKLHSWLDSTVPGDEDFK